MKLLEAEQYYSEAELKLYGIKPLTIEECLDQLSVEKPRVLLISNRLPDQVKWTRCFWRVELLHPLDHGLVELPNCDQLGCDTGAMTKIDPQVPIVTSVLIGHPYEGRYIWAEWWSDGGGCLVPWHLHPAVSR